MFRKTISLCLLLAAGMAASAQSAGRDLAQEKKDKAIALMDDGKIEPAIALLEESKKLDPDDPTYEYEIGYAKYLAKDYEAVIGIMKKLVRHKKAFPHMYQLLGNSYDMTGHADKAIDTYEKGLKEFPGAGNLYLELGVMHMGKKDYDKAIGYFESGVLAAPMHSSNYYWLGKLFCNSSNELWGLIYGEQFINLERGGKRTEEISKLLFLTYKSGITFPTDTSVKIDLASHTINLRMKDLKKDGLKLPYGITVFEPTLSLAVAGEKNINLASLHRIRGKFLEIYSRNENFRKYINPLFDYQQQVKTAGHLEAYNYWALSQGDPEAFEEWRAGNKTAWEDFINWFKANPLKITEDHVFDRSKH